MLPTRALARIGFSLSPRGSVRWVSSSRQGYASENPKTATNEEENSSLETPANPEAKGTSLLTALSSVWGKTTTVEPELSVAANGLGSVVHVTLPPHSYIYGKRGSLMACSSQVRNKVSATGGVIRSVSRKLAGGDFFMESFSSGASPADVLVAPRGIGDVAILNLDGSSQYSVVGKSCLALSPHLNVQAASPLKQLTTSGLTALHVSGRGQIAITSYGGIFRLVLEEGHTYRVCVKHLVAWESSMMPIIDDDDDMSDEDHAVMRQLKRGWRFMTKPFRPDTQCILNGPGDFFLASRIEPSFGNLSRSAQREVEQFVTVRASEQVQEAVGDQERAMRERVEKQAVGPPTKETTSNSEPSGATTAAATTKVTKNPARKPKESAESTAGNSSKKPWWQFWK